MTDVAPKWSGLRFRAGRLKSWTRVCPSLCAYSEREMREEREKHRFGPSLCTYSEREKREKLEKREKPCQWAMAQG